ncbi:MAG: hypothetical protein ACYS47_12280 [Planctomycetota bacterium]|jgi:epoxyqueuosine reductase
MTERERGRRILDKALALGASLAGIADAPSLASSPSHRTLENPPWSSEDASVLVLALSHEASRKDIDWWRSGIGTKGNLELQRISEALRAWCPGETGVEAVPLPYHVRRGGLFLKDAGVQAGLGVIGANNLLVTPTFGPRVRLRALRLGAALPATGPPPPSPCPPCDKPCHLACPQHAYPEGRFERERCMEQMHRDEEQAAPPAPGSAERADARVVKYCRACELACPVGR